MATTKKRRSNFTTVQKRVDKAIDRYMQRLAPLYICPKNFLPPDDDLSPLPDWTPHMTPALDHWHTTEYFSGNETYWSPVLKITVYASKWEAGYWFWKKRGTRFFIDRDAVNDLRKLEAAIDAEIKKLEAFARGIA